MVLEIISTQMDQKCTCEKFLEVDATGVVTIENLEKSLSHESYVVFFSENLSFLST